MRLEALHRTPVIKDIMPKLPMDEDYVIINESISFEPTDDYFAIGGKVFAEENEDCEVITKNGKTIYGNFVGDFGDHKLHLDDSFNRKGWAIKDEMIEKVNYKKVIKHTFDTDTLNESIVHAERSDDYYDDSEYQDMTNVILKNPSIKELIDNGMIECRIVKDYKDNFYFANSYEMIHTDIVDKLESKNITSVETNLFYDVNSNTFYYNVGHLADNEIKDFSEREEQMLRTSSYVSKTFKNFKFKLTYGEM